MGTRVQLGELFREILGSSNVYFQPPPTVKLRYPCIVYERTIDDIKYADNGVYANKRRYTATIIDSNPDTMIPEKLQSTLSMASPKTFFTIDNLNHYVYSIFY